MLAFVGGFFFFSNELLFSERQILLMVNINRKGKSIHRFFACFLAHMVCGVITLCCFVLQTFWKVENTAEDTSARVGRKQ